MVHKTSTEEQAKNCYYKWREKVKKRNNDKKSQFNIANLLCAQWTVPGLSVTMSWHRKKKEKVGEGKVTRNQDKNRTREQIQKHNTLSPSKSCSSVDIQSLSGVHLFISNGYDNIFEATRVFNLRIWKQLVVVHAPLDLSFEIYSRLELDYWSQATPQWRIGKIVFPVRFLLWVNCRWFFLIFDALPSIGVDLALVGACKKPWFCQKRVLNRLSFRLWIDKAKFSVWGVCRLDVKSCSIPRRQNNGVEFLCKVSPQDRLRVRNVQGVCQSFTVERRLQDH